jgi:hypothetical protein
MRFWDTSALVPLIIDEPATKRIQALASIDRSMLVWWGTEVECASALARLERDGVLEDPSATAAFRLLKKLAAVWHEIEPSDAIRETAIRFLRVHPLRAADSLQLAAALVAAGGRPSALDLVTLDDRLASAARKEGFAIIGGRRIGERLRG